jgi:hypothetical protein
MILRIESIFCISISLSVSDFAVSKLVVYLTDNIAGICIQLIWSEIIPVLYSVKLISILKSFELLFQMNRKPLTAPTATVCVVVAVVKVVVPGGDELCEKAELSIAVNRAPNFKFIMNLKASRS